MRRSKYRTYLQTRSSGTAEVMGNPFMKRDAPLPMRQTSSGLPDRHDTSTSAEQLDLIEFPKDPEKVPWYKIFDQIYHELRFFNRDGSNLEIYQAIDDVLNLHKIHGEARNKFISWFENILRRKARETKKNHDEKMSKRETWENDGVVWRKFRHDLRIICKVPLE